MNSSIDNQNNEKTVKRPNKPEILAPAGSEESLRAAVFSGADAVYFAGREFGARASAKNFSNEEIADAVKFCRARNVSCYITVNTLIKDSEMQGVLDFVKFLAEIPVDGIIFQDMGMFSILRKIAPELPLHASTQTSIHSRMGAKFIKDSGAKRLVLARELSLKEINEISESCDIELEAFVHGALCMSVSGQCYFSAMLGSRSGNRGMCAQTCRLPFSASADVSNKKENQEYALSLKDLSFVKNIDELVSAGVSSLKIEGRMKRPEYVAAAVSAAREKIDENEISDKLFDNLEAVFSRSGFTDGYLRGRVNADMFGNRRKEDVTGASEKVFKELRGLYHKEPQRLEIDFEIREDRLCAFWSRNDKESVCVSAEIPKSGIAEKALTAERCKEQLAKTGGTSFKVKNVSVPSDGLLLTISELNALRRAVLEELQLAIIQKSKIKFNDVNYNEIKRNYEEYADKAEEIVFLGSFADVEQIPQNASELVNKLDKIILPIDAKLSDIENVLSGLNLDESSNKQKLIFELPRAIFGVKREKELAEKVKSLKERGYTDFMCANMGALELCRELEVNVHGAFGLNITNSAAANFFAESGLKSEELSMELTLQEAETTKSQVPKGLMLYGHQSLMLTRNCPLRSKNHSCKDCSKKERLTDRKGIEFPVICRDLSDYVEVLNSVPICMSDRLTEVKGVQYGILRFTTESAKECEDIMESFFERSNPQESYTRGLLYRGVK